MRHALSLAIQNETAAEQTMVVVLRTSASRSYVDPNVPEERTLGTPAGLESEIIQRCMRWTMGVTRRIAPL